MCFRNPSRADIGRLRSPKHSICCMFEIRKESSVSLSCLCKLIRQQFCIYYIFGALALQIMTVMMISKSPPSKALSLLMFTSAWSSILEPNRTSYCVYYVYACLTKQSVEFAGFRNCLVALSAIAGHIKT